jgi:arabinogalactan endo-1,4-beta-galactosidase
VADPKNVEWWFDGIKGTGGVSDFDIVGFSYYPLWHTTVSVDALSDKIRLFKSRYSKDVMVLETAYPWTTQGDDDYSNHFGNEPAISGFPKTTQGQYDIMVKLTQEVKAGGGLGIIYWEPAWITSNAKDLWGTGSSWENCAFFDYDGNAIKAFDYITFDY